MEILIALELGLREFVFGLGRRDLRLGRFGLQADIGGIETSERLPAAHARADVDITRDDLAADAKAEIGFVARFHFAREDRCVGVPAYGNLRQLHGPHDVRRFDLGAARGQRRDDTEQHEQTK